MNNFIEYDSKFYEVHNEIEPGGCLGCVGHTDLNLCSALANICSCTENNVIFKAEEEPVQKQLDIREIQGKKYIAIKSAKNRCTGCVAIDNYDLCKQFVKCTGLIFKEYDDSTDIVKVQESEIEQEPAQKKLNIYEVQGKKYIALKNEQDKHPCVGCVADYNTELCDLLPDCIGIIFNEYTDSTDIVEETPKQTPSKKREQYRQKLYDARDETLEYFNFEHVHKVMKALDWTWVVQGSDSQLEVPSYPKIILKANSLITSTIESFIEDSQDSYFYSTNSGGFKATVQEYSNGQVTVSLEFILADWDTDIR